MSVFKIFGLAKRAVLIEERLSQTAVQVSKLVKMNVAMYQAVLGLAQASIHDKGDALAFVGELVGRFGPFIQASIDEEVQRGNPLSPAEATQLNAYYLDAQKGIMFTHEQALEFNDLAVRLQEDRVAKGAVDWGALALAGIAGFILAKLLSDSE